MKKLLIISLLLSCVCSAQPITMNGWKHAIPGCTPNQVHVEAEDFNGQSGTSTLCCYDGGTSIIGFFDNGDYVEYGVEIPSDGMYKIRVRFATPDGGASVQIQVDGDIRGTIALHNTGDWDAWSLDSTDAYMFAGSVTIRIYCNAVHLNLNWWDFTGGCDAALTATSITGLVSQHEANLIGGLSNTDPVSTWSDNSGNGHNMTQSGGARPTWLTSQLNGLPGIRFTASSSQYFAVSSAEPSTTPYTIFLVYKKINTTSFAPTFTYSGGADPYMYFDYSDGNSYAQARGNAYFQFTGGFNTFKIVCVTSTSGNEIQYVNNGSAVSSGGAGAGSANNYNEFGRRSSSAQYGDMVVCSVLVYDHVVSTLERLKGFRYLNYKYNVY